MRVKLFEADNTTTELDLCVLHEDVYAGNYPDQIQVVQDYADPEGGDCVHAAHLGLNTEECPRCQARRARRANG